MLTPFHTTANPPIAGEESNPIPHLLTGRLLLFGVIFQVDPGCKKVYKRTVIGMTGLGRPR